MRLALGAPLACLVLSLVAPAARAELSGADRAAILKVLEEFRSAVVDHDLSRLRGLLGPSMPETRRAELVDAVRSATEGYAIRYELSADDGDVEELAPDRARVEPTYSIEAERQGGHWNLHGLSVSFTFERTEGDGAEGWRIASTNADAHMGVGAVLKYVGWIFAILGGAAVLLAVILAAVVVIVLRRRKRAAATAG